MIDIENLKNYSLFGGVSEDHIDIIKKYFIEETFNPGDTIVVQGERSEQVYLIIEGSVSVMVDNENIAQLQEGESFGEMHLIDIMPRSATITAITDVTTLSLRNKDIIKIRKEFVETYLMLIMNCARNISRRLRKTNQLYAKLLLEKRNDT